MQFVYSLFWFIIGAVMGSTANALIYRLPRKIPWTKGRSFCPNCKHELAGIDLIPLLSYVGLTGKCRYCHKHIGWHYFIIELIMGVGFGVIGYLSNYSILGIVGAGIFWILMIIMIMDWQTKLISDAMVIALGILVLINNQLSIINNQIIINFQIWNSVFGLVVGVAAIGGIWLLSRGRAMGSGDIGLEAVLGWGLGWEKAVVGLWLAFVMGATYGGSQLLMKKLRLKSEIAFGPFLIMGAAVAYLWGDKILKIINIQ